MQALKISEELGVPIRVIHKGMDYMKIIENPRHCRGSGMNPCVDCRIYMLRKVREMMPEMGASFIITGEVLGQRPMSQQRHTIQLIERKSRLEGLILRPLSALHFEPTLPERERIVDRERLLKMSGRTRKPQFALAADLGVRDYPCPAGGCLLTDKVIAARLRDLFAHQPDYTHTDLALLTIGRHLRLNPDLKVIFGRVKEENNRIFGLAKQGQVLFKPQNFRGPTTLAIGRLDETAEGTIGEMLVSYSKDESDIYRIAKQAPGTPTSVYTISTDKHPREKWDALRIG